MCLKDMEPRPRSNTQTTENGCLQTSRWAIETTWLSAVKVTLESRGQTKWTSTSLFLQILQVSICTVFYMQKLYTFMALFVGRFKDLFTRSSHLSLRAHEWQIQWRFQKHTPPLLPLEPFVSLENFPATIPPFHIPRKKLPAEDKQICIFQPGQSIIFYTEEAFVTIQKYYDIFSISHSSGT